MVCSVLGIGNVRGVACTTYNMMNATREIMPLTVAERWVMLQARLPMHQVGTRLRLIRQCADHSKPARCMAMVLIMLPVVLGMKNVHRELVSLVKSGTWAGFSFTQERSKCWVSTQERCTQLPASVMYSGDVSMRHSTGSSGLHVQRRRLGNQHLDVNRR